MKVLEYHFLLRKQQFILLDLQEISHSHQQTIQSEHFYLIFHPQIFKQFCLIGDKHLKNSL